MLTARELVHEIEKFPPSDRIKIIDEVIRDVMKPDPDLDKVWAEEAERRLNAYTRGEVVAIPYEKVMARYRQP